MSRAQVVVPSLYFDVAGREALGFPDGSETQGWVNRGGAAVGIHDEAAIGRAQTWVVPPGADMAETLGGARLLGYDLVVVMP